MTYEKLEDKICDEAFALTGVDITDPTTFGSVERLVHDIFLVRYYGSIESVDKPVILCLGTTKRITATRCNKATFSKERWPIMQIKDDGDMNVIFGQDEAGQDKVWYLVNHALSFVIREAMKVLPISDGETMRAALTTLCVNKSLGAAETQGDNIEYALYSLLSASPKIQSKLWGTESVPNAKRTEGRRYFSIDHDRSNKGRLKQEEKRLADVKAYGPLVMFPVYMGDKASNDAIKKSEEATEAVSGTDTELFRAAAVAAQASNKTIGIETSEVTAFTQDGVVFIGTA